jgi:protein involved in polysaccharide export with SLBB domain
MKSHLLWLALVVMVCICLSVAAQDLNQNADTLLKSGDGVAVIVWRFDATNGSRRAGITYGRVAIVDGRLHVPLLGEVQAAGLTVEELRQVLQGRYAKRINERHEISITVGAQELRPHFLEKQRTPKQWRFIPVAPADPQSPRAYP